MSLYKYVKLEVLKKILNGTIRFTQPGAFNDPFEMVPELYVPEEFGTREVEFRFSVTAPRREPSVGALGDYFAAEFCDDLNSRKILALLNQEIGILSLSKNNSSLLMWSHYADRYSGAVVEFDETHEFFSGYFEMEYSDHRPNKDISTYMDVDEPIPISELCVKAKEWEYEKEVRVVRSLVDCRCVGTRKGCDFPVYVVDVPSDCIRSVTLGERTPNDQLREIWELVKGMEHVSLYVDAVSNRGYEFRREPVKLAGGKTPILSPRTAHAFTDLEGSLGDIARWLTENHPLSGMVNETL